MDRYQQMFGESFDKTNLRHVATEVIATGQAMLELADKQGVEIPLFDVHWELSGRANSCSTKLRTAARLIDTIGDKYVRKDIEGMTFRQFALPISVGAGGGDFDDFPITSAIIARPGPSRQENAVHLVNLVQSSSSSSSSSSGNSSSSSGRPLPSRERTRKKRQGSRETSSRELLPA